MRHVFGLALALMVIALAPVHAEEVQVPANPQVDYRGFVEMAAGLQDYRSKRLVDLATFRQLAAQPDAIILDTRSAAAFQTGHISGAVNLPFSDFTEEKLAEVIGDKNRPILIYCNNNFSDNMRPVRLKSAPLALNIPTFINLHGYGYENIHELADVVSIRDPDLAWKSAAVFAPR
ncbi:Rhodanese-like domain-containing protein [Parasphingorhabdus marina DSM 22363]|uniref:Rhodanese-like domain-containing protein n=2 Tax=Parasphingorhabdus marina TaxID=394732 RepID=A0A1N6HNW0_9SPHN|nr:Rhodanese-like domain-containing protein [Parasphingorhabdus marina DSM 22363]